MKAQPYLGSPRALTPIVGDLSDMPHLYIPTQRLIAAVTYGGADEARVRNLLDKNQCFEGQCDVRFSKEAQLFKHFPSLKLVRSRRKEATLRPGEHGVARVILDAQGQDKVENSVLARKEGDPATGNPDYDVLYDALGLALTESNAILTKLRKVLQNYIADGEENPINPISGRLVSYVNVDPNPGDDSGFINGAYSHAGSGLGQFIYGILRGEEHNFFTPPAQSVDVIFHEAGHMLHHQSAPNITNLPYVGERGESYGDFFAKHIEQKYLLKQPLPAMGEPEADTLWGSGQLFVKDIDIHEMALRHFYKDARPDELPHPYLGRDFSNHDWPILSPVQLGATYMRVRDFDNVHLQASAYNKVKYLQTVAFDGVTEVPCLVMVFSEILADIFQDPNPGIHGTAFYEMLAAKMLAEQGQAPIDAPEKIRASWEDAFGVDATIKPKTLSQIMSEDKSIASDQLKRIV